MDFGLVCSPWIHCQLIRYHLEYEAARDPKKAPLVNEIVSTCYIDDLFTGSNSRVEAKRKSEQLFEIFQTARYPLRKWNTNSAGLAEHIKSIVPFPDVCIHHAKKDAKLLGIWWNQTDDTIGVLVHKALDALRASPSKRTLLKVIASLFDPLGLVSFATIKAKILLQKLWLKNRDWDDELSSEELTEYDEVRNTFQKLENFTIERAFTKKNEEPTTRELHTFCDASLAALGFLHSAASALVAAMPARDAP